MSGEINEQPGGRKQRSGNDPLFGGGPEKVPARQPGLSMPGTAAAGLSVKDKGLGPKQELDQKADPEAHQEGTGQEVQVRVGLRADNLVRKDFHSVPAGTVPGLPRAPLLPVVPKGDLRLPFGRPRGAIQPAPGQKPLGLVPLKG